ncbi:MAG: LysM peptidoglycan-binding domain-containing protein [Chloracidobacterium sp.]|nr:LysM peptidoglycan-binding domain-containing protein [Chloracidobacterium sp.]
MSLQEKYQTLLELANSNGTTYELSEGDGVLHIDATAPSAEAKQAIWDEYERIDPEFRSGDLILNVTDSSAAGGGANTYTVESGDNLSKIGAKYGITWKAIYDANRDIIKDPDMIHPGQELKIPG